MKKSIKTIAASLVVAIAALAPVRSQAIDFGIRAGLDVTVPGSIKSNGASVDMFKAGCGFMPESWLTSTWYPIFFLNRVCTWFTIIRVRIFKPTLRA